MAKAVMRPKDAATLVLLRQSAAGTRVLMGQRHKRQAFMPEHYVFPGGVVEPCDRHATAASELREDVAARLARSCTRSRARALALAAIRETYEETGILVASPLRSAAQNPRPEWNGFYERGMGPDLDRLEYIFRAVTPPGPPRRFNARFFMADGEDVQGEIGGNGELNDIGWVPISDALELPIPHITGVVLREINQLLKHPPPRSADHPVPLFRRVRGLHVRSEE